MPKVSVIVPMYNSEAFIRQTLESALKQSFKDFEIIVVDDGSTDRSQEIVRTFGENIRCFYHLNMGVAKTMNRGVSASSGEYLAFLESDDLWHPEKLERQVSVLDRQDGVGVVTSDMELMEEDGARTGRHFSGRDAREPFNRLFLKGYVLLPSTMLMRRHVYEKVGGMDPEFVGACLQDREWAARVCDVADIGYVPAPLTVYRIHPGRASLEVEEKNTSVFVEKMLSRFGSHPKRRRYLLGRKVGHLSAMGKRRIQSGQVSEGRDYLLESVALSVQNRVNAKVLLKSLLRLARLGVKRSLASTSG